MIFLALAESIQLIPDGTLFLHIAVVLLMVFVLNKTLFGPVKRVLEERERRTYGRSNEAHEIMGSVEESLSRYERTLREARIENYRLLEQQRAEAIGERQRKLNTVREEIGGLIQQQKEKLGREAEEARPVLEREARLTAASVSAHILRRPVGESPQISSRI